MSKLVNSFISCPEILQSLNLYASQHLSFNYPILSISIHHTSYDYNNLIDRIAQEYKVKKLIYSVQELGTFQAYFFKRLMYTWFVFG